VFARHWSKHADHAAMCEPNTRAMHRIQVREATHLCDVADTEVNAPLDNGARSGIVSLRAARCSKHMASKVKGMVQLAGVTYRIVRVAHGSYSVVRISDDLDVGRFHLAPALGVEARGVEPALLREVARLAIHTAKTSYAGFARPDLAALEVVSANAARRSPSSMPPAIPPGR